MSMNLGRAETGEPAGALSGPHRLKPVPAELSLSSRCRRCGVRSGVGSSGRVADGGT